MSNNIDFWSFNEIGNDWWGNDLYDTKEEAVAEGKKWAKESGLSKFNIGQCRYVQIPTEIDIDYLFEKLDERYIENAEMDDDDFSPYWESRTPENVEHRKRLSTKVSKALKEYVEYTKITSHHYRIVRVYEVEVEE